ncbi:electron transporter SenC [Hymenobacter glacialis]|uniref:Electron transporter SenC n=1 Tax=Hymenobacter glacialis TaxID=1908236 RepID=A0A1G1SRI0_9BACT|nr:electron transporter SenC [Hymenobacter glacialis]
MLKRLFLLPVLAASLFTSCTEPGSDTAARLPILGERDVRPRADGGPADTIFATVPAFKLTDQSGKVITNQTFAGKAYIADFFFATCPGICPKMQAELLKVYAKYGQDPRLAFLSHTIDPAHDTIPVLRDYADRLGMGAAKNWYFATTGAKGEPTAKDSVFQLARAYYTAAEPDKQAPGGFAHNGTFALVDDQGHIRGLYDSLNEQEVARLMTELPILLDEIKSRQPAVARQ